MSLKNQRTNMNAKPWGPPLPACGDFGVSAILWENSVGGLRLKDRCLPLENRLAPSCHAPSTFRRVLGFLGAVLVLLPSLVFAQSDIRSDEVTLHSGGVIVGSVEERVDEKTRQKELLVQLPDGTTLLLDSSVFARWRPEPEVMPRYRELLSQAQHTVDFQWKLAQWCGENGLKDLREKHARMVIEIDPDHAEARKSLGHIKPRDTWIDRDSQMSRLGYVKINSQWVLPEVQELSEAISQRKEINQNWKNQLRLQFNKAFSRSRHQQQALEEILAIRDPAAVETLIEMLQSVKSKPERALIVEVLAQIPTYASTNILADFYLLNQDDEEARDRCIKTILDRKQFSVAAAQKFAAAVSPGYLVDGKRQTNPNVNTLRMSRAALGLRKLEIQIGIEALVNALVVEYKFKSTEAPTNAFGGNGSVVSAPAGRDIETRVSVQCPAALETLEAFTGQNFGFDQMAWIQWWVSENTPQSLDLRRDQ